MNYNYSAIIAYLMQLAYACFVGSLLFKAFLNFEILQVTTTRYKIFKPFGGHINIVQISRIYVYDFVVQKGSFKESGPKQ